MYQDKQQYFRQIKNKQIHTYKKNQENSIS